MDIEQRRERAIKWLKILETEVHRLLIDDSVFRGYQTILDDERFERVNGLFHVWATSNFAQAAAVAVRRLAKKPKKGRESDSVSLTRFLIEIRDNPDIVSRAHYQSLYEPTNPMIIEGLADGAFTHRAGSGHSIDAAIVEAQIARFEAAALSLEDWVDKRLAHYDESGLKGKMPTFGELETAISTLDEIVVFYRVLLLAAGNDTLRRPLAPEWLEPFEFAWKPHHEKDSDGWRNERAR